MADTTALQQQLQADPDYLDTMQAIQQMNAEGGVWQNSPAFAKLMKLNQKYQGQLPQGYGIGFDGQIHQDNFMNRHSKLLTGLSMVPAGLGIASGLGAFGSEAAGGAESILPGTESAEAAAASGAGATADAAGGVAAGESALDAGADAGAEAADAGEGMLPGDELIDNGLPGQEFPGGQVPGMPGGGILDKLKPALSKVGPILSNMSANGQKANAQRDAIMPQAENAQLARDKFALDAPTTRMNQSVKASILKTMTPTQIQWGGPGSGLKGQIPTFTGGFTGAIQNMDPRTKQLADTVMTKDLQDQLAGKDDQTRFLDQIGKESALDKIVGGASAGVNIFNALKGLF